MTPPTTLLVFGASGHAKVVLDAIERVATYRVIGLVSKVDTAASRVFGYPVLGDDARVPSILEDLEVDAWEVIRLANKHPRVDILSPGPGVGGHCIPIDPQFLADAHPFATELIQTARRVNARMPNHIVRRVRDHVPSGQRRKIALLGASYKADVDDSRESPSEKLVALFEEHDYETAVYDPIARGFTHGLYPTLEAAVEGADAVVLVVGHRIFKDVDPVAIAPLMRGRLLVDARNFFDAAVWSAAGFTVETLGDGRRRSKQMLAANGR